MDLLDEFVAGLPTEQTQRAYRVDVTKFFGQSGVDTATAKAVTSEAVRAFVGSMKEEELSLSTQRRRLAALRRFFDWLIQREIRLDNPARAPEIRPKAPDDVANRRSALDQNEVRDLISAAGEDGYTAPRDRALILTVLYAALRRNELVGLNVNDVRPLGKHWILDLETEGSAARGGYVRVPDIVVNQIDAMKDAYGISDGPLWRSLSPRNRGDRLSPDAAYKIVRRTGETAGLSNVSIDLLRRTGLKLAIEGGADLPQLQAHGRYNSPVTAAHAHGNREPTGTLRESAVDYIDVDLSGCLAED